MRKKASPRDRAAWEKVRRAETRYGSALRRIAAHIGHLADMLNVAESPEGRAQFETSMRDYAKALMPWARAAGARMLGEVDRKDSSAWEKYTREMGIAIKREVQEAPTGMLLRSSLLRQVGLITSLPTDAAQRVHDLATKALYEGNRPEEIAKQLQATGQVTKSRATLIARTEVSRASTEFLMVRAQAAGSSQYIWRTSHDGRVRPSHKAMEGVVCDWASPPAPEGQERYNPGCIYNCRCYAEPILPED